MIGIAETLLSFTVVAASRAMLKNCSLMDVDGGLIGGAALKVSDFKGIIDAFKIIEYSLPCWELWFNSKPPPCSPEGGELQIGLSFSLVAFKITLYE